MGEVMRQIESAEELHELPWRSVILDSDGDAWQKRDDVADADESCWAMAVSGNELLSSEYVYNSYAPLTMISEAGAVPEEPQISSDQLTRVDVTEVQDAVRRFYDRWKTSESNASLSEFVGAGIYLDYAVCREVA